MTKYLKQLNRMKQKVWRKSRLGKPEEVWRRYCSVWVACICHTEGLEFMCPDFTPDFPQALQQCCARYHHSTEDKQCRGSERLKK